jgi:hypothetical protein
VQFCRRKAGASAGMRDMYLHYRSGAVRARFRSLAEVEKYFA